jgi:hypothetical protein
MDEKNLDVVYNPIDGWMKNTSMQREAHLNHLNG